jgi:hypothetical protein
MPTSKLPSPFLSVSECTVGCRFIMSPTASWNSQADSNVNLHPTSFSHVAVNRQAIQHD